MYGVNVVLVSGNVGKLNTGRTKSGQDACSMKIAINKISAQPNVTWVRVNVYGALAVKVSERVKKGDYVIIEGELMNRKVNEKQTTDIRCKNIIFASQKSREPEEVEVPSDEKTPEVGDEEAPEVGDGETSEVGDKETPEVDS